MANKTIQKILEEKERWGFFVDGFRLYSPLIGACHLENANLNGTILVASRAEESNLVIETLMLGSDAKKSADGECMLFPSSEMRDWNRFAWESFSLVVNRDEHYLFFDRWASVDYTSFSGFEYVLKKGELKKIEKIYRTSMFYNVTEKEATIYFQDLANKLPFIKELYGESDLYRAFIDANHKKDKEYKQNLQNGRKVLQKMTDRALASESSSEEMPTVGNVYYFRHGDYSYFVVRFASLSQDKNKVTFSEAIKVTRSGNIYPNTAISEHPGYCEHWRLATKEEEKLLIDVIKKWKKEKSPILVSCPFKPKDWCLMRNSDSELWELCQFAYDASASAEDDLFVAVGGINFYQCIPYKGNEKLLGTIESPTNGKE